MKDQDFLKSVEHCLRAVQLDLVSHEQLKILVVIEDRLSHCMDDPYDGLMEMYLCDLIIAYGKRVFGEEVGGSLGKQAFLRRESILKEEPGSVFQYLHWASKDEELRRLQETVREQEQSLFK